MSELNPQHPNNLPETAKDPFDEFSFDDLMQMDLNSPVTPPATTAPSATSTEVDFDNLFAFDDTPPPPAEPTAQVDLAKNEVDALYLTTPDVPQATQATQPAHQDDFADTFSQLDSLNHHNTNPDFVTTTTPDFSQPDFSQPDFSQPEAVATTPTMPETTAINPMDMVAGVGAAGVAGATAATLATDNAKQKTKSALGGMFGKKDKVAKPAKVKKEKVVKTTSLTATPKKNNKLLPLILGLLVIGGIAAWLFNSIMNKAPEPKPVAVKPVAKPTPAPVAQSTSAVATVTASSTTVATSAPVATVVASSAPTATATATASGTATTTTTTTETKVDTKATTTNTNLIKPEEILAKPIPGDPALAKEEMDKLADQSARLAEQEKMMEDQLKMTKELSDKKAERIALLEQQIAQLEAQKGQAKK